MNHLAGSFEPPAERCREIDFGREKRNSDEEHGDVAQKNDHGGKEIALLRDVALLRFQNVPRQRDVKGVGRADNKMEPDDLFAPVPDQVADGEDSDGDHDVNREKIGCEAHQEVVFGDDDMAAVGGGFEFFQFAAEEPGPEGVGQFMAENVNEHRFGQHQEDHEPTRRPSDHGDPKGVGFAGSPHDKPECFRRAEAERKQKNGDDEFRPLGHGFL